MNAILEQNNYLDGMGVPAVDSLVSLAPASAKLYDELTKGFAPESAALNSPQSYWIAFNAWITNELSRRIMKTEVSDSEFGGFLWAAYASSYWGGMELRENWGMPPAMERLGIALEPPYLETLDNLAATFNSRLSVMAQGNDKCLDYVDDLLHEDLNAGALWNTAYNAGCQVIKTEDAPIGQRRPHRRPQPSMVRINTRDFMRVDYELPAPEYLRVLRSAFEVAVTSQPETYEQIIVGKDGQKDLREIWAGGVGFGNTSWGDGANDAWTDEYFDDTLHWSTVVNFGLEAVSLACFAALINKDADLARRAVMGNAMYAGMATGWLLGMLNVEGSLPARG
ncbi:hypothetical protein HCU74_03325 [Spongiibacter sp. KMU-166]|uniref:Uncharacterized protein n=1 Tax=Spongiibacter thalassae TaxID=2721624 RepID=A0ABX1GBA4_9GAMM|nr:hypothetical protein [Spongiibacter thalassae]NKI16446.1 hypothetical protein [Spongiibacter thalassae]